MLTEHGESWTGSALPSSKLMLPAGGLHHCVECNLSSSANPRFSVDSHTACLSSVSRFCSAVLPLAPLIPAMGKQRLWAFSLYGWYCSATDWSYCLIFERPSLFSLTFFVPFWFFFYTRCSTWFLVVDTSYCWWDCSPLTQASSTMTASPSLLICSVHHGACGRCSQKAIGRE